MISFGGPDHASQRLIGSWPGGLFVAPGLKADPDIVQRFLIEQYFANGAALFGRETSEEIEMFRSVAGCDLDDDHISQIIHYYVCRIRNYAYLTAMASAEFRYARTVNLTAAARCEPHADRVVDVLDAVGQLKWFQVLEPVEYERLVYGRDFGFPPYGVDCLCRMEAVIPGVDAI